MSKKEDHQRKLVMHTSYLFYCAFLVLLFLSFSEFVLRIKGYTPWRLEDVGVVVEPGGRFFVKDGSLGYTHLPGTFKVTLPTNYSFNVSHLTNTLRITHPLGSYNQKNPKKKIWVFGGSFTYGWALNDRETYPWLLQEIFPDYEVVNFGVNGYGTLHSLIQFRKALEKRNKPALAIFTYASFHDERNTFLRSRRKSVVRWNRLGRLVQPYARINNDGMLEYSTGVVEYAKFPFMEYSAFIHFIENQFNRIEDRFYNSHKVSITIIKEISRLCEQNDIALIVAGIYSDPLTLDTLACCEREGIMTTDISVDLKTKENNCLPYDPHPSARANKKYAQKLESFLVSTGIVPK